MEQDTVVIGEKEYELLAQRNQKLFALESAGVQDWEGYDTAMEIYEDIKLFVALVEE